MTDATLLDGYLTTRDDASFEALLERHGAMVWRVCRGVLRDPNDAEDAFQATFLVLVRTGGSIRDRESLGRWLYETAFRVSMRAKSQAARRPILPMGEVVPVASGGGAASEAERRDLQPAIHAELGRLPEDLRTPILLCYFEGLTQEEAARRLRCPLRTFKGRLARGREMLRSRLTRRGIAVTLTFLMLRLERPVEAAPADLVERTKNAIDASLSLGRDTEALPARVERLIRCEHKARLTRIAATIILLLFVGGSGVRAIIAAPSSGDGRRLPVSARAADMPALAPVPCH